MAEKVSKFEYHVKLVTCALESYLFSTFPLFLVFLQTLVSPYIYTTYIFAELTPTLVPITPKISKIEHKGIKAVSR